MLVVRRTTNRTCAAFPPEVDFGDEGQGGIRSLGPGHAGAYALGYHSAPVRQAPVRATGSPSGLAQPVALSGPAAQLPEPDPRVTSAPAPSAKAGLPDEKPSARIPSARSRPRSRRPLLQRSSSKLVALSTMRAGGRAPAQTIPCETAGPVAGEALTLDLAGLRRFVIGAM